MDNVFTNCFYGQVYPNLVPKICAMTSESNHRALPSVWRSLLSSCLLMTTVTGFAQYGVSPSQTGVFFDDLRGRAGAKNDQIAVRQGGEYDFSQGGYQNGGSTGSVMEDASRQINQSYNGMGNLIYSNRQAGDYTQYSGPYPASSTFFAPPYTSDPLLGGKRNLKVGPLNLGFGLTSLLEYNDNITRTGVDPVSDFIGSAYLNISANYPLTETTALSLSTAIGFDHYFDHPELAPYGGDMVLNVLPGSTIAIDGKIGPVYVVVYDRMSVRPAIQNYYAVNNRSIFGVFQNDAGLGASWAINSKLNLSLNYVHSDAIALEDADSIYDRTTDSVQASLAWSPTGTWTAGLEGSNTWLSYPEGYNNDGVLSNIGAFFAMPVGKSTSIRLSGGVQNFEFDAPPEFNRRVTDQDIANLNAQISATNARAAALQAKGAAMTAEESAELTRLTNDAARQQSQLTTLQTQKAEDDAEYASNTRDNSDLSDYYFNFTISNRLSSRISHALNFGHESSLNTTSNFISADYISYGMGIIAWSGSRLSLSGYYENAQDSGGTLAEEIEQWGFDAYFSHQLTSKLRFGLGYHYGVAQSSTPNRDYTQQAFNVDLNYTLSRKMNVGLGYRFFTTDADTEDFSFDQNRVVMSANYNF